MKNVKISTAYRQLLSISPCQIIYLFVNDPSIHGVIFIPDDLVCTKWTTCKLYMIARRLSRNLKWCQRPVVIGSRWPTLHCSTFCRSRVGWKREWESTQVGAVPLPACSRLPFSWNSNGSSWTDQVLKLETPDGLSKTRLKNTRTKEWLIFLVADLVREQQTGGPTGRPPQGRCGGAEDGAGHQGECGRNHQIRSTSRLNH